MKPIRVTLELEERELQSLAWQSNVLRDDPRKRWSQKECREHAAIAVQKMVRAWLDERKRLGLM